MAMTAPTPGRAPLIPRLCNSRTITCNVPLLPKLHGKTTLVTTKLCEQIYKSTTGHVFDLTAPKEHMTSILMDYNSLHDPYLKSYFYRHEKKTKLIKNGFITKDLGVICSLKEYNAYRNFLENEFLKLHKAEFEVEDKEKKKQEKITDIKKNPKTKEREETRKQFFIEQEKKLRAKQHKIKKQKREEELVKLREMEKRKLQQEKNEMKREAEREQNYLRKMQKEQEQNKKRKKLLAKSETSEYTRLIQLHALKQKERMKRIDELESRWQKYDQHAQMMHEQRQRQKEEEQKAKEERMKRREKLFMILQEREEERKMKLLETNHQQIEQLKEEADQFETHWLEAHNHEVQECREKMKKKQQLWSQKYENQRCVSHLSTTNINHHKINKQTSLSTTLDNSSPQPEVSKNQQRRTTAFQSSLIQSFSKSIVLEEKEVKSETEIKDTSINSTMLPEAIVSDIEDSNELVNNMSESALTNTSEYNKLSDANEPAVQQAEHQLLINHKSNNVHLYNEHTNDSTVTADDDLTNENEETCQVKTDVIVNIPDDIIIKTNINNEVNEVSPSKNEKSVRFNL